MYADRSRVARTTTLAAALVALASVAGCADGEEADDTSPASSVSPTVTEPLFTPADGSNATEGTGTAAPVAASDAPAGTAATSASDGDSASTDEVTTLPTIPDTGVPGIDSTDQFCRAWSEFGGTFQGLAISWGVGDPADAARNEVAASGAVLVAVENLDANLPPELEAERADLMTLVGPLSRRAEAGRDALLAAGLGEADVVVLGDAWIATLVDVGIDDPAIAVVIPDGVDATAVDAAATAFADGRQSLVEDPTMITDVAVPQTEQYLLANCPDQGTLLGNDDVSGAP